MINYNAAYKLQMAYTRLDFEAYKPRINPELRIMMVELQVKLD